MYYNLNNSQTAILTGKDAVVIKLVIDAKEGGVTLDTTGFTPTVISAGHPIIRETSTGKLKPMPVNGGATAYAALPSGHTYYAVALHTNLTAKPAFAILFQGVINPNACPYDFSTIAAAFATAVPKITQRAD